MNKNNISPATRLCGIIGHPVAHSMSPAIHNDAFEALQLDYVYLAFNVLPGNTGAVLDGMRAMKHFRGLSVTIPHKVDVMQYVDSVSETDQAIGAINTIINTDGHLRGLGSDGPGARNALLDADVKLDNAHITILGTGGASRAIAFDLALNTGIEQLNFLGLDKDEMTTLADDLRNKTNAKVTQALLDDHRIKRALSASQILINATPVGMHPNTDQTPVDARFLHNDLAVMDIVYNPLHTRLLQDAKTKGIKTISGIEMFLHQAAIQFEAWTEHEAPAQRMRHIVMTHLGNG